jgi:hypothetical protein
MSAGIGGNSCPRAGILSTAWRVGTATAVSPCSPLQLSWRGRGRSPPQHHMVHHRRRLARPGCADGADRGVLMVSRSIQPADLCRSSRRRCACPGPEPAVNVQEISHAEARDGRAQHDDPRPASCWKGISSRPLSCDVAEQDLGIATRRPVLLPSGESVPPCSIRSRPASSSMACSWYGRRSAAGGKAGNGACGSIWYQKAALENRSSRWQWPSHLPLRIAQPRCSMVARRLLENRIGSWTCQR